MEDINFILFVILPLSMVGLLLIPFLWLICHVYLCVWQDLRKYWFSSRKISRSIGNSDSSNKFTIHKY